MRDGFPDTVVIGLGLAFAFALSLLVFVASVDCTDDCTKKLLTGGSRQIN